ncbi:XRE family transcriptional regulator [Helicobacter jaachi]|uniref:XRE family transcriptional regulator n=1 Tax=Helicobacter jaachi TaxID=1677920 RepID=A0A4U8T5L0_9HELI|nr:hypothetical protein [Helicobacter jaachi]TLD94846.1 XRE family transcriptional regulator [Helicobacter jaachi]
MDKQEFRDLMKQAGFKKKLDLARALGLSYQSVNNWGSNCDYPQYLKPFLLMAIKAKKYDELMASSHHK